MCLCTYKIYILYYQDFLAFLQRGKKLRNLFFYSGEFFKRYWKTDVAWAQTVHLLRNHQPKQQRHLNSPCRMYADQPGRIGKPEQDRNRFPQRTYHKNPYQNAQGLRPQQWKYATPCQLRRQREHRIVPKRYHRFPALSLFRIGEYRVSTWSRYKPVLRPGL